MKVLIRVAKPGRLAFVVSVLLINRLCVADYCSCVVEALSSAVGGRIDFVSDGIQREDARFVSGDPELGALTFRIQGLETTVQLQQLSAITFVEVCKVCNGNGYYMGDYDYTVEEQVDCPDCNNGQIVTGYRYTGTRPYYYDDGVRHSRVGHARKVMDVKEKCSRCNGTGKIKVKRTKNSGMTKNPCKACNGTPNKTVNLLQKSFMKYIREGFESHVRIEKGRTIGEGSRKLFVDDTAIISALSALKLDWFELTDAAGRTLVLVCPAGTDKPFAGNNIDIFHLADLGKDEILVSDNQLVAAFFKAKQCPEMNPFMRNQVLANCESKINKSPALSKQQ